MTSCGRVVAIASCCRASGCDIVSGKEKMYSCGDWGAPLGSAGLISRMLALAMYSSVTVTASANMLKDDVFFGLFVCVCVCACVRGIYGILFPPNKSAKKKKKQKKKKFVVVVVVVVVFSVVSHRQR